MNSYTKHVYKVQKNEKFLVVFISILSGSPYMNKYILNSNVSKLEPKKGSRVS